LLPEQILWRKKSPYPKTFDPEYMRLMRARMELLMGERNAPLWSLVDRSRVEELAQGDMPWPWYGQLMGKPQTLAYLLQIDCWLRHYNVDIIL
jgi:asparagine synthase (glutamine-hydrolysing)